MRNPDWGVTYVTNVTSEQVKAGLRLHINVAESGPTSPGFQSLSIHTGIVAIVNDFEAALTSLNYCVRAFPFPAL